VIGRLPDSRALSTTLRYIQLSMADLADEYRRASEEIQRRYQVRG
jgi:hypothetical protein